MGNTKINDERILAARHSLAQRVAALEDRVTNTVEQATGTVEHATSSIRGTIDEATRTVRNLCDSTGENVKGVLDLRRQVRDNPWQGLLLAVGAGLATRWLSHRAPVDARQAVVTDTRNPLNDLFAVVRRELVDIGESAVASVSKKLKENIASLTDTRGAEDVKPVVRNGEAINNGRAHYNSI